MEKPTVIVIAGPTASGKSKLAVELAKKIDGEIVSADSMQIYMDMDIGTAKVTNQEMQGIKHYMLDFVAPNERYSVSSYKKEAEKCIEEIISKGKTPIICGGTGLYIDSLIYNIEFLEEEIDETYRNKLNKIAENEGLESLYNVAMKIDPKAMEKISKNDQKRIIRVLEIYHKTGKTKTEQDLESRKNEVKYNYKIFAINMDREILYNRINKRVDKMIQNGLIDEVKLILQKYEEFPTAIQGLGYKEVVQFLNGQLTKEEMIEKLKMETRRYAKRQITWFKKNKETYWINRRKWIRRKYRNNRKKHLKTNIKGGITTLANKNARAKEKSPKKNKETSKKNIVKMLIPILGVIAFIYVIYKIIGLIVEPTNMIVVEKGTIFNEEDAVRICYKR